MSAGESGARDMVPAGHLVGVDQADAARSVDEMQAAWSTISAGDEVRIRAARRDVNDFIEFVGVPQDRHHLDGTRIREWERLRQTEFHENLQELMGRHPFLAVMAFPGSGKTTQVIYRIIWMLGHNPNLRLAIVSQNQKSDGLAAKISRTMRMIIERSRDVQRVFPNLRPGPVWKDHTWMLQRSEHSGDVTCQIVGIKNEPTGARLDVIMVDDMITGKNTRDEADRTTTSKWFRRHILDRLGARSRVMFLCNAQHPRDIFHQWEGDAHSSFKTFRFPVVDAAGEPTVPEIWPQWRIDRQRSLMMADGSSAEYNKAFLCVARDDDEAIFDPDMVSAAFRLDYEPVYSIDPRALPRGAFIVVAVDPATRKTKKANQTAFTAALVWPIDGTRQVLWVKAGKYRSREIAEIIFDLEIRYSPVFHVVENNAAQAWLEDIIDQHMDIKDLQSTVRGLPAAHPRPRVYPYHTGVQKVDPFIGLDGLSSEVSGGRWIIPHYLEPSDCQEDLTGLWADLTFCRRVGHTPDRLMSLWLLREGIRFFLLHLAGSMAEEEDGQDGAATDDDLDDADDLEQRSGHACPRCGRDLGVVLPPSMYRARVACENCGVTAIVHADPDFLEPEASWAS